MDTPFQYTPVRKRKTLIDYTPKKFKPDIMGVDSLYNLGLSAYNKPEDLALYHATYLFAGRISEIIHLTTEDLVIKKIGDKEILIARLLALKNRRIPFKHVPVPLSNTYSPKEISMINFVMDYAKEAKGKLWPYLSRTNAFNRISKNGTLVFTATGIRGKEVIPDRTFTMYPHYLRHLRLNHLVDYYGFDKYPSELQEIAGWTSLYPAMEYIRNSPMRVARKMLEGTDTLAGLYSTLAKGDKIL